MKNTFGNSLTVTLFGESHGKEIGVVIDGLTPGMDIDNDLIEKRLSERRPSGTIATSRKEHDCFSIVSGVFKNKTTGTPLCITIPNEDTRSRDYESTAYIPRPSHADFTAFCKYGGFQDYRGGGHFSGRLTAPLVAAGAIAEMALLKKGIRIVSHIRQLGNVQDTDFPENVTTYERVVGCPTVDPKIWEKMISCIEDAKKNGDSVGGIIETAVIGMPAGVGEPWFDSVEGMLSHAIFAIPAVKGIEFGSGFGLAGMLGSEANDAIRTENGKITTKTNHNGGINGGITNGMPILFRTVVKPTPSIYQKQESVDLRTMTSETIKIEGRHDPAIVHRALPVIEAVSSLVLADLLLTHFGTNYFLDK